MNQKINRDVAEILGAFVGDGWIEKSKKGLYITGDKIEDKDYYDLFLSPLFSKVFSKVRPREFSYWNVYGIACYKKDVINSCLKLGFQSGSKALTAKIPKDILNCQDEKIIKAVLRGVFDADGSFWCEQSRAKTSTAWKRKYHYHPEIRITSCSLTLLNQMKQLLRNFKIESTIVMKAKAGRKHNRNVNNSYALNIRKINHIKRWFEIIGTNNPRHKTRYSI